MYQESNSFLSEKLTDSKLTIYIMNQLKSALEQYGLSEKEAGVYLALLSLGIASVAEIAKRACLKRPTTYLVIEELLNKHLVNQIPRGKKICYKAESPDELIEKIDKKRDLLTNVLPDMRELYKTSSVAPRIRYYEGKASLIKLYEEIFRSKEIWSVFSPAKYLKVFTIEESKHNHRILDRAGGIIYDLCEDSSAARKFTQEPFRKGLTEYRILPKSIKIATDILVYNNSVALVSLDTLVGVLIEDKSIADTQRMFIKHLWEEAED